MDTAIWITDRAAALNVAVEQHTSLWMTRYPHGPLINISYNGDAYNRKLTASALTRDTPTSALVAANSLSTTAADTAGTRNTRLMSTKTQNSERHQHSTMLHLRQSAHETVNAKSRCELCLLQ